MEYYRYVYGDVPKDLQDIVAQIKLPLLVAIFLAHLVTVGLVVGAKRCAESANENDELEKTASPVKRPRLQGPCAFGCLRTTAKHPDGAPRWRKLPIKFQGQDIGRTVCGKHYQEAQKIQSKAQDTVHVVMRPQHS